MLAALVDKSLVVLDDRFPATRYQMLETLREFARERLLARNELDAVARAHAEYFAALAEPPSPTFVDPLKANGSRSLEAETWPTSVVLTHGPADRVPSLRDIPLRRPGLVRFLAHVH